MQTRISSTGGSIDGLLLAHSTRRGVVFVRAETPGRSDAGPKEVGILRQWTEVDSWPLEIGVSRSGSQKGVGLGTKCWT